MFIWEKSKGHIMRPFVLYLENALILRALSVTYFHTFLPLVSLISAFHAERIMSATLAGIGT